MIKYKNGRNNVVYRQNSKPELQWLEDGINVLVVFAFVCVKIIVVALWQCVCTVARAIIHAIKLAPVK